MIRFSSLAVRAGLVLAALYGGLGVSLSSQAQTGTRPFRGSIPMSILLCKYNGADAPDKAPSYYANMAVKAGSGGHADLWKGVSYGSIDLDGSNVRGWYTLDKTADQARDYGGGSSSQRVKKYTDCKEKAKENGYTPPSDHIVIVITSPGIDVFGLRGGAFLGENANIGTFAHEVGHGLGLDHSYSNDFDYKNATWAGIGEYDDPWDLMGSGNVFGTRTQKYGIAPVGLNAYHRDRMGWIARKKILRFGPDGDQEKTVTLTGLNSPGKPGHQLIRIPYSPNDPFRYLTVEYRAPVGVDRGLPEDRVLIHDIHMKGEGSKDYKSYLLRDHRPVVIAGPPSENGPHPGVVRLRIVRRGSFQARFQEWDYRKREHGDTRHTVETIPYLTIEPGRHRMPDGSRWEAGTFHLDGTRDWQPHRFHEEFPGRPKVFLTAQSFEGGDTIAVRARSVDEKGFEAALFEEEALNNGHLEEIVGYLAVYDSDGQGEVRDGGGSADYSVSTHSIDNQWTGIGGAQLHLEEETSKDEESSHLSERVDVLKIAGRIFAQPVTVNGNDPIGMRRRGGGASRASKIASGTAVANENWKSVSFGADLSNPVVLAGPASFQGRHPGVVRLQNVAQPGFQNGFQVRFQEWDYRAREKDDTNHADENIPYLAVESGRHSMPDDSSWEAGTFRINGTKSWSKQRFRKAFSETPKVFLTVQTANGQEAISVRARNVSKRGFEAALFEEEALNDGHVREVVGYLAVHSPSASGTVPTDGISSSYKVGSVSVDDQWSSVGDGVQMQVQEEKSASDETDHVPEQVDFLQLRGRVLAQDSSTNGANPVSLRQRFGAPNNNVVLETGVLATDLSWSQVNLGGQYGTGTRLPKVSVSRNGVSINVLSTDPQAPQAKVRIEVDGDIVEAAKDSFGPNTCKKGYVWREADQRDWVCVPPERRAQVKKENRMADQRVKPGGGRYGPDTCKEGFVWREAFPGDHVCVTPESREKAEKENRKASQRLAKEGA